MTAFVENLSAIDTQGGSPSNLAKSDLVSYSPIAGRVTPGIGGSADRYERIQTFGGSPLRHGAQGARDGSLKLRTTPLERQATEEDVAHTPAFFGGQRNTAAVEDGPRSQQQEEEEKKEGEEDSVTQTPAAEEDFEANRPQELKFCYFLKMQLRIDKNTEIHKEVLSSNTQFNVREAFRIFDQDNKGFITEADLAQKIADLSVYANPKVILEKFDRDGDGKLSYQEFKQIVTPLNQSYYPEENHSQQERRYITESFGAPKPEVASRLPEYLRQSWIDDLKEILYTLSNADALLINERNNQQLDADYIFGKIDKYRLGYITVTKLADWLS